MKRWGAMVILLAALWVAAEAITVRLGWNPCDGADNYRVFAGPHSRGWDTNWMVFTNAAEFVVPDVGQWWFAVRAERHFGNPTNFAASAMSDEVMFELLPPPVLQSETWVSLRPVIECSTNLFSWSSMTGAATWLPATNAQEFFRTRQLVIERVQRVEAK